MSRLFSLLLLAPFVVAEFGHTLLPRFAFRSGYVNLNHGSYGSAPRDVTANASAWSAQCEESPDAWYRDGLGIDTTYEFQNQVRVRMAQYINANVNDTVFVDNASNGVNAVMRSLARAMPSGKKILLLSTAYYMVKATVAGYLEPESTLFVNISLPGSDAGILEKVSAALEANAGTIYAASFSHIVSVPAVILPVAQLIALCHSHGVLVLIDGAHALGQIPVDVTALDADFWLGNGHKWLYSPKGSALLWVRPDRQALIEPTTISWEGQGLTHFQMAFSYVGTTDNSRTLAMSAALDFRKSVGTEAAIVNYMHTLAVTGGRRLAEMWGTELLFSDTSRFAAMVDVRVPTTNSTLAHLIGPALMTRFNTFVPIYDLSVVGGAIPNTFYARVSCQIYTELSDIEFLATSVKAIIASGG
jgi:selenocysteine lyase/cysteine desulfurase